jgi:hypothetical protein
MSAVRQENRTISIDELADSFARDKYVVWRSCLKDPQLSLYYRYTCKRADLGTMIQDPRAPGADAAPGDFFIDALLLDFLPSAEAISRLKLFPTFSYFRVYKGGDFLVKHTDRPSCEISISLCLGYEAQHAWPLLLEVPTGISSIELEAGDALFYRGMEVSHWRERMNGQRAAQVFLHYVDQTGPYAEWKYDKRKGIPSHKQFRNDRSA